MATQSPTNYRTADQSSKSRLPNKSLLNATGAWWCSACPKLSGGLKDSLIGAVHCEVEPERTSFPLLSVAVCAVCAAYAAHRLLLTLPPMPLWTGATRAGNVPFAVCRLNLRRSINFEHATQYTQKCVRICTITLRNLSFCRKVTFL